MKRSTSKMSGMTKRKLCFEALEDRHLLSATILEGDWYATVGNDFNISSQEQELLEWINQMRNDPKITLDRILRSSDTSFDAYDAYVKAAWDYAYSGDLAKALQELKSDWDDLGSGLAPLAFSKTLLSIANTHTEEMVSKNSYFHSEELADQLSGLYSSCGENVYGYKYPSGMMSYSRYNPDGEPVNIGLTLASFFHSAFAIDWGNDSEFPHRANIMSENYTEIGISIGQTQDKTAYVTEEFGGTNVNASGGSWLLGVIYDDMNNSGYYDTGEGLSNKITVTIKQLNSVGAPTGNSVVITPFTSGGYQILLANGVYSVTVNGPSFEKSAEKIVAIAGKNVKLDFLKNENIDDSELTPIVDADNSSAGNNSELTYSEKEKQETNGQKGNCIDIADRLNISNSKMIYAAKVVFTPPVNCSDLEMINIGSISSSGLICNYIANENILYINGPGTAETYEALLHSLQYVNDTLESSDYSDRTITVSVYNGYQWSNTATITVHVDPAPVTLTIESQKVIEGDSGMTEMRFTAILSEKQKKDITFTYEIGSAAMAGLEYGYEYSTNTVTIKAGELTGSFIANIYTDRDNQIDSLGNTLDLYRADCDVVFDVAISEIKGGAELAVDPLTGLTASITGTIIDDDTPLVNYAGSSENGFRSPISDGIFNTVYGSRKLVYSFMPSENGLVLWNVDSNALQGCTLSVYSGSFSKEENRITSASVKSNADTNSQTIQWSALSGHTYIVVIEQSAASEVTCLSAEMLKINTNNVVMLDPLLDELETDEKLLFKFDGNDVTLSLGNGNWTVNADSKFGFDDGSGFSVSYPYDTPDWLMDRTLELIKEGNSEFLIKGSMSQESLMYYGTTGDDSLVYQNGSGSFTTNIGTNSEHVWNFSDLSAVSFNAFTGNDTATITDSLGNDTFNVVENTITFSGSGYLLSAENFNKVDCLCESGGQNTVYMNNQDSVNTSAWLISSNLIVTGNLSKETVNPETFAYVIQYFDNAVIKPLTELKNLTVVASSSSDIKYSADFGFTQYMSNDASLYAYAEKVQNLKFSGFSDSSSDSFELLTEKYSSLSQEDDKIATIKSSTNKQITLPVAFIKSVSASESLETLPASADEEITAAAVLDLLEEENRTQDAEIETVAAASNENLCLLILDQMNNESTKKNKFGLFEVV